ncbi:hypothetical protein FALBO_841 [Fusarium albosuccineum]|uniref:Uncharacterized protein n=1 Tax=Fusarium albosuccineum TaxID=1237068 RepID=A0A8H4LQH4_9HYPO|nr:hypothetical protein FALBO_841 [Fusarium albosuccineum]
MAVVSTSGFHYYAGLDTSQRKLLYEPLVLEYAMIQSCALTREEPNSYSPVAFDDFQSDEDAFQTLANKLAQVCDNERGGDTVTALTVLQAERGPEFVLASNRKDQAGLQSTEVFLNRLLRLVGDNPEGLNRNALEKRVLWMMLSFNIPRVTEYQQNLRKALDVCLKLLGQQDAHIVELQQELERIKGKCYFSMNVDREQDETKGLSDCESLIKMIHSFRSTEMENTLSTKARDSKMDRSQPWCDLRHYLGRWHSYRQAASVVVGAANRWPSLFQEFSITMLPSSSRMSKPIGQSDLTAVGIFENMQIIDKSSPSELKSQVEKLGRMGLDDAIQSQVRKRKFRPIVHAEMVVHDYLIKNELTSSDSFWNGWKYIGASKPACRLCYYYFTYHPQNHIPTRSSHMNLYPNWRLPEISTEDPGTREEHADLIKTIAQKLRRDVKRSLEEKTTPGKKHDSNTYSATPVYLSLRSGSSMQPSTESLSETV